MNDRTKKILLWLLDLGINIAIIFILVLVIQKWIIAPFDISGSSMCNNLNVVNGECQNSYGEKIIINEAGYFFNDPERGEIVVFKASQTEDDKYFIKRVIGLPGDTIELKNGQVFLKKAESEEIIQLKEPYLNEQNQGNTNEFLSGFSVFEVPQDHYFLMGDNRVASTDSRSCFQSSISTNCKDHPENSFINRDDIRGKAWFVWWPLKNIRIIPHHIYEESLAEK